MFAKPDAVRAETEASAPTPVESFEAAANDPFVPRRFLRNGHLQTLAGNFLRRSHSVLPAAESRIIEVEAATATLPSSSVLCYCHWQPTEIRKQRPTILLLHGLEGSSESQYVRGNAARAWSHGCNVVRMNMRNCGGTEHLSPTLYHSGLSGDVLAVLKTLVAEEGLQSVALIGYSMGGNLVLKLAGELGKHTPAYLKAVVGVSPAMDLGASADALHEAANRIYEWKFLHSLLRRFRRKVALFPHLYKRSSSKGVNTLRAFDDRITAQYSGFRNADDYYAQSSSSRVAATIAVPTLILHALDDPFVRMLPDTRSTLKATPLVTLIESDKGGHCAFLSPSVRNKELAGVNVEDGYWAEKTLLRFVLRHTAD